MSDASDNRVVLALPPRAPRMPRNRAMEGIGRGILRLFGWRMVGAFPDIDKAVVIAAPHSSNWDGLLGFAAKLGMGVRLSILGKDSLFKIPLVGAFLRWQGVIPVDRSAPEGRHIRLSPDADRQLLAPIAPGLIDRVGIAGIAVMRPGAWHSPSVPAGSLAFDGERELTFTESDRVSVRLVADAFRTIDVPACMAFAAAAGLFIRNPDQTT